VKVFATVKLGPKFGEKGKGMEGREGTRELWEEGREMSNG
jgi:hypothetical protein